MLRILACAGVLAMVIGTPVRAADPKAIMSSMDGTWNCSFAMGGLRMAYRATYAPAMGSAWLRQTDDFGHGTGDEGMYSYSTKTHRWSVTIMEPSGQTTLMLGDEIGSGRIAYASVYPDASMRETFDRVGAGKYEVHFTQTTSGKRTSSVDVCTKI